MTKAEQRALEMYPVQMVRRRYDGIVCSDDPYDSNLHDRYCCQRGYEQAEKDFIEFVHQHYPINYVGWYQDFQNFVGPKTDTQAEQDLALTWEDMRRIHRFAEGLKEYIDDGIKVPFGKNSETFYTEVLNRFNKSREEKK